ncbi:MAG: extracellular solute-binding protein [Tissierellia bacterium]|nr:extracellular solute-binding protein [Tissierellia bacterium]
MKNMKKVLALLLVLVMVLAACGNTNEETPATTDGGKTETTDGTNTETPATAASGSINVVSREDGSGTRGAFVEIVGVVDENGDDQTSAEASIQSGTGKVIAAVSQDDRAIGYISLGSLDSTVKAVKVDGVEATEENVLSGEYKIQRPLLFVYKSEAELSDVAKDFLNYAKSKEGQDLAVSKGFVRSFTDAQAFTKTEGLSGSVSLTGSTSVGPLASVLAEEYMKLNPDVKIEIQETGSGAGIKEAMSGANDIGMSSRDLKAEETLEQTVVAKDGIAVIVAPTNATTDMSLANIKEIYLGNITTWEEVK